MNTTTAVPCVLDRRGKTISTFVVFDMVAALRQMDVGARVELIIDDFGPLERDIRAWCDRTGHQLVSSEVTGPSRRVVIEKGSDIETPGSSRVAMVISEAGLEELLSPLGFALAAALEGMHVDLFFQGPAVRVLASGFRPRLSGWARPFSRFAAAGMAETGHVAAQDKLRQLEALGARFFSCGPSMLHFKVDPRVADLRRCRPGGVPHVHGDHARRRRAAVLLTSPCGPDLAPLPPNPSPGPREDAGLTPRGRCCPSR